MKDSSGLLIYHSEPEWNISNKNCLAWNIAQTYDFCIPLDFFLRSLVSKKSSGMQKSYVWAIFHAKQFLLPIFHSGSLCIKKQLPRTSNLLSYNLLKSNFPQPLVKHVVFVEFKPRKLEDDGKHAGWTFSLNCKGLPSFRMI